MTSENYTSLNNILSNAPDQTRMHYSNLSQTGIDLKDHWKYIIVLFAETLQKKN